MKKKTLRDIYIEAERSRLHRKRHTAILVHRDIQMGKPEQSALYEPTQVLHGCRNVNGSPAERNCIA